MEFSFGFHYQRLFASGKLEALRFAWEVRGNLSQLQAKVQEIEELISNPGEALKGPLSPGAGPRIYRDGYLEGLKEAIKIISTDDSGPSDKFPLQVRVLSTLLRQILLAEGREAAFDFAWEIQGNLSDLQARIREIEQLVSNPPEFLRDLSLPSAGPHIYLEGYLTGLKDIIEIISSPQP